jgi:hypothetical protein
MCVWFLRLPPRGPIAADGRPAARRAAAWTRIAITVAAMSVTAFVAMACFRQERPLAAANVAYVPRALRQMLVHPPIDAFVTAREATEFMQGVDRDAWNQGKVPRWADVVLRYMHECVAPGDHVFVSGSTPYHNGYLVERPVAGGQLFWHYQWRSDPRREEQTLSLLKSQSIPFAFSTHDPVLDDLKAYPRIRGYFLARYAVFPGTHGHLLVDSQRTATGRFGPLGFPCFR